MQQCRCIVGRGDNHSPRGFRVVVFSNDHNPPHVHVFRAGAEAIVELTPIRLRENYRMSKRQLRRALEIIAANEPQLIDAWRATHGTG